MAKRGHRKRQISRCMVNMERDLPRLATWIALNGGRPFRTGDVNRALYPHYDKARTKRMEASPGLILLRAGMARGWVEYGNTHGRWLDVRGRSTIGERLKGAR